MKPNTKKMLSNIFDDKYLDIILDYLSVLLINDTVEMPSLHIFGDHKSGKSTFLKWIDVLLSVKADMVNVDHIKSSLEFHSVIILDEQLLNDKHYEAMNAKIVSYPRPKTFIISSKKRIVELHNTCLFWCIHFPPIKDKDPTFLNKLINEIPATKQMLINRKTINTNLFSYYSNHEMSSK